MNKSSTPLRYPGGKQKMAEYLLQIIRLNTLSDGLYIEPYAGGAGLALELLFSEKMYYLWLNDADPNIYAFWNSVLTMNEELVDRIHKAEVSIDEWKKQKEIIKNASEYSEIDRGFAVFFLNRCNISGILKGGPIGGQNQTGKWKIDARFNKTELIRRIHRINMYKSRITVSNLDAIDFLKDIKPELANRNSLIYLDPPYYKKGSQLYLNAYLPQDHEKVASFIKTNYQDENWLISYDVCEPIAKLYQQFRCSQQILNYSVTTTPKKGTEFIFYSDQLAIPENVTLINPNDLVKNSNDCTIKELA